METSEYSFIKREILSLTGINIDYYKETQMRRRLKAFLTRSGYSTWQNYFQSARSDEVVLKKLKDYLTINVSAFFRDTEKYKYLQRSILPSLMPERKKLRIWSAGCSRGQEPYSLAILLTELTGGHHQHYILATDLDRSALAWAQDGGPYSVDDVANVSPIISKRYFHQANDGYWIDEAIRKHIRFRQQDLLADPFEQNFDLIVCRNVVIYFTASVKEKLYKRFNEALRPGGFLFVGGTEIIPRALEVGFETTGISFYCRTDLRKLPVNR